MESSGAMKKGEIDTPALLVDRAALLRNIEGMQRRATDLGVALRPHIKTHKSPAIARMQVEAGAKGVTVAKLGEGEVMADARLEDILIANQVIAHTKMQRLVELAGRVRLAVLVDSREGVEQLENAFAAANGLLDVLIEVDTGKGRCGLTEVSDIVALADAVADAHHLHLRGVETHEGHVADGARSAADVEADAIAAGRRIVEVAEALRERGHAIDEISVGSTPAAPYTASIPGITEMRPGTYVFNDVNQLAIGQATPESCALSVLATVISRPAGDRAVLDSGSKSLFAERARSGFALEDYEGFGYIRQAPGARITSLSEEHAVVHVPKGLPFPSIGEQVEIIPNHVCPAVNLHDELLLVEDDEVVDALSIAARGKVH